MIDCVSKGSIGFGGAGGAGAGLVSAETPWSVTWSPAESVITVFPFELWAAAMTAETLANWLWLSQTWSLPEVKLGLLPGAGGTQRLPRLLGAEHALNMIVSGATVPSEKLRGTALFDAYADGDLLDAALALARQVVSEKRGTRRVRDIKPAMPNYEAFFAFARNTVKAVAGRYPAPLACLEAVAAAFDRPFEEGIKRERELFVSLMLSPESMALRHLFQAERAASHIKDVTADTPTRTIKKVGIIGAGTMGGGIAMNFINVGIPVVLLEMKQEALDRGLATIRKNYGGALKKGALTEAALGERLKLISPTLDYAPLGDVDLVRSGFRSRHRAALQKRNTPAAPSGRQRVRSGSGLLRSGAAEVNKAAG